MPSGWRLTVDRLIVNTSGEEWEPGLYALRSDAAQRLANQLNEERPWDAAKAIKAIASAGTSRDLCDSPVVDAEVVA